MAKNRYVGEYPAIGIRPIIDGRRGPMQLRESLEGQVMEMALAAGRSASTTRSTTRRRCAPAPPSACRASSP